MRAWSLLLGPAAVWLVGAIIVAIMTLSDASSWGEPDRRTAATVGSADCRRCHPRQYDTWHASYHRTMTQQWPAANVLAPFAGETFDYLGFRARMTQTAAGRPHVTVHALSNAREVGAALLDVDVWLTVGSHHYQQYVARIDRGGGPAEAWRLPVAWHREQQRWTHMNAAFLEPEGRVGISDDYLRHLNRWNDNCAFCHNTEPVPGLEPDGTFRTRVAEFGIACEACHGPASLHHRRHENPMRRLLADVGEDASVAHPGRLDAARGSEICGRCHGQRIGKDIAAILRDGDGFVPGKDLAAISRPIWRDSTLAGEQPFAARFWPDGSPRLSAYEYQGLLASPCHADGRGLSCNDCHDMHGDAPDKQVRHDKHGARACIGCHDTETLSGASPARRHGGHGSEVDCLGCHMPRITYGLLEGMISHRIQSPDPAMLVGRDDQPDACTQCHVTRSRSWAAAQMSTLGLASSVPGEAAAHESWASRVLLDLLGGDPVQRALAVHALARPLAPASFEQRAHWLVLALADDYPAIRWMAWRALQAVASTRPDVQTLLHGYDPLASAESRVRVAADLAKELGSTVAIPSEAQMQELSSKRDDQSIWIGE